MERVTERHTIHTYITEKHKTALRHRILDLVHLIDLGRKQCASLGCEVTKPVQKYEYIIISFLDHRRHTASPLPRPTSECSSWKHLVFVLRNKQNTATDSVDRMESYFCYSRCHTAHIVQVAATARVSTQLHYGFMAQIDDSPILCHSST